MAAITVEVKPSDEMKQMLDELKKLVNQHDKRLADAWRELFAKEDFNPHGQDHSDHEYCIFCGEWSHDWGESIDCIQHVDHKEDCIYMRVKAILAVEKIINEVD